jgi:hypothetical protein
MGNLMQRWQSMVMSAPHKATASGRVVTVATDVRGPMTIAADAAVTICGKNLFDGQFPSIGEAVHYRSIYVGNGPVTVSSNVKQVVSGSSRFSNLFALPGQKTSGAATGTNDVYNDRPRIITPINGYITIAYRNWSGVNPATAQTMIEVGSVATAYEPYAATTDRVSKRGVTNVIAASGNATVTYWVH